MNTDEIVRALRENAEWCDANEYEVPLCMGDNQRAAADLIETLQTDHESYQQVKKALQREGYSDIETMISQYKQVMIAAKEEIEYRRAQPENKPLTPDELREMDGEPVWVHEITAEPIDGDYWAIIAADTACVYDFGIGAAISPATDGKSRFAQTPFRDYGKTWLAYRSKPEEGHHE